MFPAVGHRRSLSTDEDLSLDGRKRHRSRSSPSEKARLHFHFRTHLSAMSVGKEMSLGDPHYRPRTNEQNLNPFATLPRFALIRTGSLATLIRRQHASKFEVNLPLLCF